MMSSLTKAQFRDELKLMSAAIASFADATIETFIDNALRAYSEHLPEYRVSADNTEVSGQELYNYPAGAMTITKIIDSSSRKRRTFSLENETGTPQFRLGPLHAYSTDSLIEKDFYVDPLSGGQVKSSSTLSSTSDFDIEYLQLQDMASIKDTGLGALRAYCEYLALSQKASDADADKYAELIDADASGASTTIRQDSAVKAFLSLAQAKLKEFERLTEFAFGVRG